MTELLSVSGGRIVIRGTDGGTRFDSDEKLFYATDFKQGEYVVASRQAQDTYQKLTEKGPYQYIYYPVDITASYFLHAVNSRCDTVVGAFSVSSYSKRAYGVHNLGWFNANGSYLHYFDDNEDVTKNRILSNCQIFTFYCSGGGLYLKERSVINVPYSSSGTLSPGNQYVLTTVPSVTFRYKLYCGTFI